MDRRILETLVAQAQSPDASPLNSTGEIVRWVAARNEAVDVGIQTIPFSKLDKWCFDPDSGFITHDSGKFFSIRGINVKTNWGEVSEWDQPIINQPEIGYLGILTKNINGVLHFLLQAKVEPGNVNRVQLSPTLQATKSNYSRIHQGAAPKYFDYFSTLSNERLVFDQLQSEQGARFLGKRNRNLIIYSEEEVPLDDDFIWVTLRQIKELLRYDNLVNMDTRTVIAGIPPFVDDPLARSEGETRSLHRMGDLIAWLTAQKCRFDLDITQKSLFELKKWQVGDSEITHDDNLYFKVVAADVRIHNREVAEWSQPLIQPIDRGLVAFVYKRIEGQAHFLVQSKLECGNFDTIELAPTVQCLTSSYALGSGLPYLDYVLGVDKKLVRFDTVLSEEGGRFYQEQNRHIIVEADENFDETEPMDYRWISLPQLYDFMRFNNYLNIQARSLLSAVCLEMINENSV